jgi:hypothetical protein
MIVDAALSSAQVNTMLKLARTYIDNGEDEVLIGIPGYRRRTHAHSQITPPSCNTIQLNRRPKPKPRKVEIPIDPRTKRDYLQVREIGTDACTAIEPLSNQQKKDAWSRHLYRKT